MHAFHDIILIYITKGVQCMCCCHLRNLLPRMLIAELQQSAVASLLSSAEGANEGLRSIQMRCMAQPQPEAGAARGRQHACPNDDLRRFADP